MKENQENHVFQALTFSDPEIETISMLKEHFYNLFLKGVKNEDEKKHAEQMSTVYAVYFHSAVSHFVYVSPITADIAHATNLDPDIVIGLSETGEWKEAVKMLGFKGDPTPKNMREKGNVPFPLQETYLLMDAFSKDSDVRLVTYDGFIDTRVNGVFQYNLQLAEGRKIKKHDVILAFPQDRMPYVKKGIKCRKSVADLGLQAAPRRSDRAKIEVMARKGSLVECVMRNGLVVTGENVWISKYNIVLRVGGKKGFGGKIVLLYRHALHEFRVVKESRKRQDIYDDEWDDEADTNGTSA